MKHFKKFILGDTITASDFNDFIKENNLQMEPVEPGEPFNKLLDAMNLLVDKVEAKDKVLSKIANWELPEDDYELNRGSWGARDYIKNLAFEGTLK
ncbi:MAG: hypothetical protein KUG81_04125 [Gammaproteobacteria bacterium]|nr:hypothetical protein [Gammaproteobacteria bacterium]